MCAHGKNFLQLQKFSTTANMISIAEICSWVVSAQHKNLDSQTVDAMNGAYTAKDLLRPGDAFEVSWSLATPASKQQMGYGDSVGLANAFLTYKKLQVMNDLASKGIQFHA
jgi:hypothetical protein